jgi:NADH-quinone oxidoreductase subunit A
MVAVAFMVFDVELLFLYPWAVAMRPARRATAVSAPSLPTPPATDVVGPVSLDSQPTSTQTTPPLGIEAAIAAGEVENRHLVFGGALVFIALLAVGLVYDWRKGVFQWR